MTAPALPLCLTASIREQKALRFNERAEVRWFGFQGAFVEPGESVIRLLHREAGAPGGGRLRKRKIKHAKCALRRERSLQRLC